MMEGENGQEVAPVYNFHHFFSASIKASKVIMKKKLKLQNQNKNLPHISNLYWPARFPGCSIFVRSKLHLFCQQSHL